MLVYNLGIGSKLFPNCAGGTHCLESRAMINCALRINSTDSALTAVHLFHVGKSCQLGQLQLKTAAQSSSTNHMEKAFEEIREAFFITFCELGMKPEKLEG